MTNGKLIRLEADRVNHQVQSLSNATKGKAVLLQNGEHLSIFFCLRTASRVKFIDLRYSNGNEIDTVAIKLDAEIVGTFSTSISATSDWNTFMSTGVSFNSIDDGFVIDYVDIDVDDKLITQEIAMCEVTCIPNFMSNLQQHMVVSEGLLYATQNSFNTTCTEINNVNIPIYDQFVKMYAVMAVMPKYVSFSNPRFENTNDCYHLSPFLWKFRDINFSNGSSGHIESVKANLSFDEDFPSSSIKMAIKFNMEGKSKGNIDADIGTILRIKFSGMTGETIVQMQYKGRAAMSSMEQKILTPHESEASWSIPDFTWTETDLNLIEIQLNSSSLVSLSIITLSLARRQLLPDKVVGDYKNDDVIVEAVAVDLWWLTPNAMQLTLSNGQSYSGVSYIRVYRPILWNLGYAQVFVMYQDGYTRLLPIPPNGVDWIPFGSSVVIGQANPTDVRPYSAITNVSLDIETLRMDVMYADGGSAKLQLQNNLMETHFIVSDIVFGGNTNLPFAIFRSMYVSEGNSDVDHVRVNNAQPIHIMDDFGFIMGLSFNFYRTCTSKHLNLSPDIYINIKRSNQKY
ncbi:hypothetical protein ACJMK2_031320 [Sinanodonta woodiana]|uniref:Uncharacterized protein n=1 Tax=Sinanodonta woodiana TaxID=1069815 RepID=A0ABD3X2E0_SINWO